MNQALDPQTPRSREMRLLAAIVLLAAVVRLIYWLEIRDLPLVQQPTGDAATYVAAAADLLSHGVGAPAGVPYSQAPLYPFVLAGLSAVGLDAGAARALQMGLGVLGVVLLWGAARRLGGPVAGWTAALGGALFGPFVFFENELLSISLAVFFLQAVVFLWGRARYAPVTGAAWGLAALAQPNLLLAGLITAGASVLAPGRWGWPTRSAALLLLAGLLVFPALTLTRNLAVSGEPVLISTNGGINFFIGNNAASDGTFHLPPGSGLINRPEGLFAGAREAAEADKGRALSHMAVDRHWWLRGVDFWAGEPGRAVGLFARKVLLTVNNYEIPNHFDYTYFKSQSMMLRVLPTFGWLFPLGALGLLLLRSGRDRWLLLAFAALVVSVALFFVTARYRLPLAVVLWPAAGYAVSRVVQWRPARSPLAWAGAAAAAFALLAFYPLVQGGDTRAHMLNLEGSTRYAAGDLDGAQRAFEDALKAQPGHPEALNNLGRVLARRGDVNGALANYRAALRADPTQAETYLNLEELYRAAGRNAEAIEILDRLQQARGGTLGEAAGVVGYRRGVNQMTQGDTLAAVASLEAAVTASPDLVGAWLNLSTLYRVLGQTDDALRAAEEAVERAPDIQEVQARYASSLEAAGRYPEAALAYDKALEAGPPSVELHYRLGRLLVDSTYRDKAERHLVAANEGQPHPEALWSLGNLYEKQNRPDEAIKVYQTLVRLKTAHAAEARERLAALRPAGNAGR